MFYLQDVEDEQYVSDVSALISEMQSNAGDVMTYSPATTGAIKGPDFWEPMVNGEVDISIIYDYYDTIYTNLPQNIYEEYPDANLFYANISTTAAQELETEYSGGAVKACFIGEMTYEDMANTSDDGIVISTYSTIVLNDITGMNTVGFVTSILDNECGDYQVIDIDGDAYLNGEYNIFDDFDPNDYNTIVVTDSRILEYLAPDLDSYGFGGNVFRECVCRLFGRQRGLFHALPERKLQGILDGAGCVCHHFLSQRVSCRHFFGLLFELQDNDDALRR